MSSAAFDDGLLVGLLVGEGHFGGDGRQPQVTLRMHVRHEALFRWLVRTYPGGRLYGPYAHGGRQYYQWMVRGDYLRDSIVPLLKRCLTPAVDQYAFTRFAAMCTQYRHRLDVTGSTREARAASGGRGKAPGGADTGAESGSVGTGAESGSVGTGTTQGLPPEEVPVPGVNDPSSDRAADAFRSLRAGSVR